MTDERHIFHAKFLVIPIEALALIDSDEISWADAALLSLIYGLRNHEENVDCFASNRYLAKRMKVHVASLQRQMLRLEEKGYLTRIQTKGRRYLKVHWEAPVSGGTTGRRPPTTGRRSIDVNNYKHTLARSPSADRDGEEDGEMMRGLNGKPVTKEKGKGPPPIAIDVDRACQLLQATNPRRKYAQATIRRNARHFRLLREYDGYSPQLITAVLDHHCEHLRDKYEPKAMDGEWFRKKFEQIHEAYRRLCEDDPDIEITELARNIHERLLYYHWPKGCKDQLLVEVQLGLNFVTAVRTVATQEHKRWKRKFNRRQQREKMSSTSWKSCKMHRAYWMILQDIEMSSYGVQRWYSDVWHRVSGWDAWSGDLSMFRFSLNAKHVKAKLKPVFEAYPVEDEVMDKLREGINEGIEA